MLICAVQAMDVADVCNFLQNSATIDIALAPLPVPTPAKDRPRSSRSSGQRGYRLAYFGLHSAILKGGTA
jgi:hypothetical protein